MGIEWIEWPENQERFRITKEQEMFGGFHESLARRLIEKMTCRPKLPSKSLRPFPAKTSRFRCQTEGSIRLPSNL